MTAPVLDGSAHGNASTATTNAVTLSTTNANDIICVLAAAENTAAPSITGISSTSGLAWNKRTAVSISRQDLELWWAYAPAALSSEVITITYAATFDDAVAVAFGVTGCNTLNPFDANSSLPANTSSTTASVAPTSTVSTVSPSSFMIMGVGAASNSSNYNTPPTGFTFIAGAVNTGGGLACSAGVAYEAFTAAQSSLAVTWGGTLGGTNGVASIVDALVPAPSTQRINDRVQETTTTTGTGTLTLAGAMTGYQAFSSACKDGDTCYYGLAAVNGSGAPSGVWEVGIGTYTASGNTLSRTTILASSNAGAAVTLPTGTTQVWLDMPAASLLPLLITESLGQDQSGFMDGNFDFWDVNTTFSLAAATDTYTADMWVCNAGAGGAATVSQNTPALGSEIAGMVRPRKYRLSYQQTTNATTSPTIGQKCESVTQYNGQYVTVSGTFAAASAATLIVGARVTQYFGTGGSPSATVTVNTKLAWAIGTSEGRFSAMLAIPSVAGKTLGTAGDYLRIDLLLATGATYTLYASQLQIDPCNANASANTTGSGGAPQSFRYRGVNSERDRMTHLARLIGPFTANATINGFAAGSANAYSFNVLDKPMRIAGTGSVVGGTANYAGSGTWSAATVTMTSPAAWYLQAAGSGGTAAAASYFTFSAAGAGIFLDARL